MPRPRSRFQIFGILFAMSMLALSLTLMLAVVVTLPVIRTHVREFAPYSLVFWVAAGLFLLSFLAVIVSAIAWIAAAVRELPRTSAPADPLTR